MFRRVLLYFRARWSSTDPVDRLLGAFGKAVVELGGALLISGGFVGLLFLADSLIGQIRAFDLFPLNLVLVTGPVAFVGGLFWCEIILDMRQVEDDREESEPSETSTERTRTS